MKRLRVAILAGVLGAIALLGAAGVRGYSKWRAARRAPSPGQWEVTIRNEVQGGAAAQAGTTGTQCLTVAEPAPRGRMPPDCDNTDVERDGAKLKWRVHCTSSRQTEGVGEVEFDGSRLEGRLSLWIQSRATGARQLATQLITGRRVGDCTPGH